jgi:hypothetical protein
MNKEKSVDKVLNEIAYLFIIFFFSYTAINKLLNIESFRTNLIKTSLFDVYSAHYFSFIVIFWEFIVIILLLFYKKIGVLTFTLTMLLFTIYISFLKSKRLYEVCGCGGVLNGLDYKYHFAINIFLILLGLFLLKNVYQKN